MPSQFLPQDAEDGVAQLLENLQLGDGTPVNVGSIGELDINDDDELVFDSPMARTRYAGSPIYKSDDNQALNYQDVRHIVEVWCFVENLKSKKDQREDSVGLLGLVLPLVAGARIQLSDGGQSEPCRIVHAETFMQTDFGTIYIAQVEVPGIAQFPNH